MTPEQMKSELERANRLLVEKLGKQPYMWLDLRLRDTGRWAVTGAYADSTMEQRIAGDFVETPEEAFTSIFAVLNAMPDPEAAAKHKWQVKLADVIDEGHSLNLPEDVMGPLRQGSLAMTENLLTSDVTK